MLIFILAIDKKNLIGNTSAKFGLPWHYPEDLKFYKEKTINQICVVGRNTYEQMNGALANRTTIVMSRNENLKLEDAQVINDKEQIIKMAQKKDVYICGGVEIFSLFVEDVNEILLTRIDAIHSGDVYFDNLDDILKNFSISKSWKGETKELDFQVWSRNEN